MKDIENSIPFDLPNNWCWIRLQEIADIARGGSPRPIEDYLTNDESGINWIKIGDTKPGSKYIVSAKEKIKAEGKNHSRYVHAGDFLLTNSMSFGRPYILKIDGCIHDGWLVFANIKNCLLQDYLYHALSSKYIYDSFSLVAAGSTVKNLKSDTVKQVLFPLPPINEQKRIVEEIERITEIIEKLDDDKLELSQAIIQAKSKILDLAIHGKLVPQDLSDEPASVLLEKLRADKEAKIRAGELKRDKNDSYIYKSTTDNCYYQKFNKGDGLLIQEKIKFEIPEGWSWCLLRNICSDFIVPQRDKPTSFDGTIPWCRIEDIEGKYLNGSLSNQLVSMETIKAMNMHICPKGSIICSCSASIGVQAIATVDCCTNQTFIGIVPIEEALFNEYLYYFLGSQTKYFHEIATGTTIKYISRDKFEDFIFPLPPLAEQKRIVEKIENAFAKLNQIAEQLA